MKSQFVLLALLVLGATADHFNSGSNFCDDEKDRYDTCKPLVNRQGCGCGGHSGGSSSSTSSESGGDSGEISGSGSGSGNGTWEISGSGSGSGSSSEGSGSSGGSWGEGEYCFLLQVFLNYSITLDIEFREIFIEWINITQITIVEDVELTEYEILVKIWYSLQILFEEHVEIETAIKWLYIGDWGYVFNLEGLAIDIQSSGSTQISIQEVITISGGSCPLTTALDDCKQNATSSQQAEIEILIEEITVIINGYYSFDETLVLIFEQFDSFFTEYPDLKTLIFSAEIEGFGILQSYFDICNTYWRIANFSIAVGGSSSSDCKLLEVLTALYENQSYTISERSDFKQLEVKIQDYFQVTVDIRLRVTYFAEQLYQFFILEDWCVEDIYSIEIEGYGTIYDLIYAYIYCTNNGVGPGDFTVSAEPSTSTVSTTSTTAAATTTKPNGNCATVTTVNVVSVNTTLLLAAIDADQKTSHWNDTLIATFSGYEKKIYVISTNTSTTATAVNKFNSIKTVLTGFTTKADFKAIVYAIFIETWGTIGQYVNCTVSS